MLCNYLKACFQYLVKDTRLDYTLIYLSFTKVTEVNSII